MKFYKSLLVASLAACVHSAAISQDIKGFDNTQMMRKWIASTGMLALECGKHLNPSWAKNDYNPNIVGSVLGFFAGANAVAFTYNKPMAPMPSNDIINASMKLYCLENPKKFEHDAMIALYNKQLSKAIEFQD